MVCVTRIFRALVHDVGTTSSAAVGQIPICLPTPFRCHKNSQVSLKAKHGNFHTNATEEYSVFPSHQGRMEKGRYHLSERNRGLLEIKLKLKLKKTVGRD